MRSLAVARPDDLGDHRQGDLLGPSTAAQIDADRRVDAADLGGVGRAGQSGDFLGREGSIVDADIADQAGKILTARDGLIVVESALVDNCTDADITPMLSHCRPIAGRDETPIQIEPQTVRMGRGVGIEHQTDVMPLACSLIGGKDAYPEIYKRMFGTLPKLRPPKI